MMLGLFKMTEKLASTTTGREPTDRQLTLTLMFIVSWLGSKNYVQIRAFGRKNKPMFEA